MRGSHNFHARDSRAKNFKSKRSLAEALKAGEAVTFTDTSAFDNAGTLKAGQLFPTDVIVGPDPYRDRSWYANVKGGKVV
jgi:hypothetical protein